MERNYKQPETDLIYKPSDIFNDMATKSKIYRHLVDINDTITEDDIRNIVVAFPGSESIKELNGKQVLVS